MTRTNALALTQGVWVRDSKLILRTTRQTCEKNALHILVKRKTARCCADKEIGSI